MTKQEGVIKFQLDYTSTPPLEASLLRDLIHWREVLYDRSLIGQDPARYGGFGFGNISARLPALEQEPFAQPGHPVFAISGTQTGDLPRLGPEHYALVIACYPDQNRLVARGPVRPSSESLTHGILYALDDSIRYVMHAHSPHIWRAASALGLPTTQAAIPYGTPEMAAEVRRLFTETDCSRVGIFSMGGHEDGIVSFGATADLAGQVLLAALEKSLKK